MVLENSFACAEIFCLKREGTRSSESALLFFLCVSCLFPSIPPVVFQTCNTPKSSHLFVDVDETEEAFIEINKSAKKEVEEEEEERGKRCERRENGETCDRMVDGSSLFKKTKQALTGTARRTCPHRRDRRKGSRSRRPFWAKLRAKRAEGKESERSFFFFLFLSRSSLQLKLCSYAPLLFSFPPEPGISLTPEEIY